MAERPILFSAPMVRAILAGTKTQTRRPLRDGTWWTPEHGVIRQAPAGLACTGFAHVPCPYGSAGDTLWVREHWHASLAYELTAPRDIPPNAPVMYQADGSGYLPLSNAGKARRAFHMPRWASRITLEITGVRVERLQDISIADAMAEGVIECNENLRGLEPCLEWRYAYEDLWRAINGPGSWDANPWVWILEFRRISGDERVTEQEKA